MNTKRTYLQNCLGVFNGLWCKGAKAVFKRKIESCNILSIKEDVAKELLIFNKKDVEEFLSSLYDSVSRSFERIIFLQFYDQEYISNSINEAVDFQKKYSEIKPILLLSIYEITIKYNTGDRIEANFKDK